VGLTGGLAAGKTTVAEWLRDVGFRVIDADELVAELYRPEEAGAEAVREFFGEQVLDEKGGVDHVKLAAEVFEDQESLRWLEAVVHPLVRRRFEERAKDLGGVVILEGTLLVEAGYGPMFDLMVSVEAPPEVRLARAVARGLDEAEASRRLEAQGDGALRRAATQRVILNNGTLDELRSEVDELVKELRELQASPLGSVKE
jgi:dephospho-CoA kinase